MPKRVKKSDAVKAIREADELEVLFDAIDRTDSLSKKRLQANRFIQEVQKQIQDERGVILVSVKVR